MSRTWMLSKITRLVISEWPYLTCFAAGILLFLVGNNLQEEYKGLIVNISASFFNNPTAFSNLRTCKAVIIKET